MKFTPAFIFAFVAAVGSGCAARQYGARASGLPLSETSVRSHMEFLASDALAGRGSGTRDEWIAAMYIAAHMRRIGRARGGDDGGFVQAVTIERGQAAAPPVLSVAGDRFTHGEQMLVTSMRAARSAVPLHKVSPTGGAPP